MKALPSKKDATEVIAHDVTPLEVNTDAGAYARIGWIMVVVGFVGFMLWASFAPLDKGVPLQGTITSESNRQAVQNKAGGTVQKILVRDGDVVKAGQVLIKMNEVVAKSEAAIARGQYLTVRASEARLVAERDGLSKITFPQELLEQKADPAVANIMSSQEQLLTSRQISLQSELSALSEGIAGLKLQIVGTQEGRDSKKEQLKLLKEQLDGMRDLAKDGYVARNRLLELERTYAQINGAISEDFGNIGRAQRQVTELTLRRSQRQQEHQKEVRTLLADVQREAQGLQNRVAALNFELGNVDVRAPVDGTVVGLAVFTEGGVVGAGFKMMDIVPSKDPLVVDGRLPVNLVDKVHPGLKVDLMLTAFNTNKTPHIPGEVVQVSADRTTDERTGEPYYKVRVKVTPEGTALIAKHKLDIQPGMPADMFIKTGERTMMNYLLKPLFDRTKSSMSED